MLLLTYNRNVQYNLLCMSPGRPCRLFGWRSRPPICGCTACRHRTGVQLTTRRRTRPGAVAFPAGRHHVKRACRATIRRRRRTLSRPCGLGSGRLCGPARGRQVRVRSKIFLTREGLTRPCAHARKPPMTPTGGRAPSATATHTFMTHSARGTATWTSGRGRPRTGACRRRTSWPEGPGALMSSPSTTRTVILNLMLTLTLTLTPSCTLALTLILTLIPSPALPPQSSPRLAVLKVHLVRGPLSQRAAQLQGTGCCAG